MGIGGTIFAVTSRRRSMGSIILPCKLSQSCKTFLYSINNFSSVLTILGILTAASTFYDVYMRKFELKGREVYSTFSVVSNFEVLLKINRSNSVINCIDGLKVLSGELDF